jgi:hypothetical protein
MLASVLLAAPQVVVVAVQEYLVFFFALKFVAAAAAATEWMEALSPPKMAGHSRTIPLCLYLEYSASSRPNKSTMGE